MNITKSNVCAVVVTYNRKVLLKECVDAILAQTYPVSGIIIYDNASTDGTEEYLSGLGYIARNDVIYIRSAENIGGSGGFYEGIKRAYESGCDWAWAMDDDAEPRGDALESLLKEADADGSKSTTCLASLLVSTQGGELFQHRGMVNYDNMLVRPVDPVPEGPQSRAVGAISITHCSLTGILVPRRILSVIGFPNRGFFIYFDDLDYSIRISKAGEIRLIPASVILHKDEAALATANRGRFLWLRSSTPRIKIEQGWRIYYLTRNIVYIYKRHCANRFVFRLHFILFISRVAAGIILFDDFKVDRLKLVVAASRDGLNGQLGKKIDPAAWRKRFK